MGVSCLITVAFVPLSMRWSIINVAHEGHDRHTLYARTSDSSHRLHTSTWGRATTHLGLRKSPQRRATSQKVDSLGTVVEVIGRLLSGATRFMKTNQ